MARHASFDQATALVIVDVQNDFADPAGSLYVKGGDTIVAEVNRLIGDAQAAGSTIVYTQDWHPPATPHFASSGGVWPDHCVRGSWGAELHPALIVSGRSVMKGVDGEDGYSGFTVRAVECGEERPTGLAELLREAKAARVVVCGLATDYCVRATALDAVALGFGTSVVLDAVAAVDRSPGDGESALAELAETGVELV